MIFDLGNVYARKPEMSDIEAIYAYRNDPDVFVSLGGHHTGMSRDDIQDWIEFHRTNPNNLVWVLATFDSDTCVGHAGLYNIDYRRGKAELGTALAKSHWGGGLGARSLGGLIDFAFKKLRLHRLETFNLETNKKIVKIKETLGFTLEGILRDVEFRDGRWLSTMCMTILEHEWKGLPEKYIWRGENDRKSK